MSTVTPELHCINGIRPRSLDAFTDRGLNLDSNSKMTRSGKGLAM